MREIGQRQRRQHARKAQLDRPGPHDVHAPPRAHVVVRRRRVPVDPADRQAAARIARMHAQREHVAAGMHPRRHVELVHGIGAGDVGVVGDLMPVHPHIGAGDHAVGAQQRVHAPARSRAARTRCDTTRGSRTACRWHRAPAPRAGCRCRTRSCRCRSPAVPPSPWRGRSPGTSRWVAKPAEEIVGAAFLRLVGGLDLPAGHGGGRAAATVHPRGREGGRRRERRRRGACQPGSSASGTGMWARMRMASVASQDRLRGFRRARTARTG